MANPEILEKVKEGEQLYQNKIYNLWGITPSLFECALTNKEENTERDIVILSATDMLLRLHFSFGDTEDILSKSLSALPKCTDDDLRLIADDQFKQYDEMHESAGLMSLAQHVLKLDLKEAENSPEASGLIPTLAAYEIAESGDYSLRNPPDKILKGILERGVHELVKQVTAK